MTDTEFKKSLLAIFEKNIGDIKNKNYAFLELDTQNPTNRIEYPGYDKDAQRAACYDPKMIPGFRSCVKTVFFINECNRDGFRRKGRFRWLGNAFEQDDCDMDHCDSYAGHIFLLIANSVLSDDFAKKSDEEKLNELIEYSDYTIKQLDNWGYYPVSHEIIPEINGCLPEQIYTHSKKHLTSILKKIEEYSISYYAK